MATTVLDRINAMFAPPEPEPVPSVPSVPSVHSMKEPGGEPVKEPGGEMGDNGGENGDRDNLQFIEDDIERRARGLTSWKKLDMCFKWKAVVAYLKERDGTTAEEEDRLLGLVRSKKLLDVEYDAFSGRIVSLGPDSF